ncbi:MAG: PH domain-containing protein [Solirubrobacterales bacterium]|nr:PH domain-containing protein [Solirubrobacterales bacterium]
MELRDDETMIFDGHPSPRATLELYAKGDGLALAVGAILWFLVSPAVGVLVALTLAFLTVLIGAIARRRVRYVITSQRLYIREGLLSKYEQQTRLDRIQDVSTRQSFFQRMLGIGTVDFDTAAGESDEDFAFHGVADPGEVVRAVDEAQRTP